MSQLGDFLFSPSENLILSDFSSLAELDDFRKDLFLGNTMEGIPEAGLLGELDCKDDLKLISEVSDVFEASLKVDDGKDSRNIKDIPFALFVDSESLQFMSASSELGLQTFSADIEMKSVGLTSTVSSSDEVTDTCDVPYQTSLVAADELNCMSLDEVQQLTPRHGVDTMCVFRPPLHFEQRGNLTTNTGAQHLPSIAPSSSFTKDVVDASVFNMDARSQFSVDRSMSLPVQIKTLGRSLSMTFCKSDVNPLSNTSLRSDEGCNVLQVKSTPVQSVSANSKQDSANSGVFGESLPDIPSLQRSQSSNSLGQVQTCRGIGFCTDVQTQPACKQEIPFLLPSATCMSFFSLPPYQASGLQGVTPMRRVYSTGDLQAVNGMQSLCGVKAENSTPEDTSGMRIGQYTVEERKMKLYRYRQKRTERNFSKKIKYACRKTLADNRPRVRGRFARSDEMCDSGLKGNELPLIDEYETATTHCLRPQVARDQQVHLVVNNSCTMSSNPMAKFWTTMGMKVAM